MSLDPGGLRRSLLSPPDRLLLVFLCRRLGFLRRLSLSPGFLNRLSLSPGFRSRLSRDALLLCPLCYLGNHIV